MYNKVFVFSRPDGGVTVTSWDSPPYLDETEREWLDRGIAHLRDARFGDGQPVYPESWLLVAEVERPANNAPLLDKTFRDAWTWTDKLDHDMEKCREIHKARLREARAPLLAEKDVEYMRALERGDATALASISAEKQALRDVTADPAIAAAATAADLKAVWPAALKQ